MSFMDQIKSQASALSSAAGEHQQSLGAVQAVAQLMEHTGGAQGLLSMFQSHGLGSLVQSWIGTGANAPISAQQITSVIGEERLNSIAQKVGLQPQDLQQKLATYLPMIVDKLTPHGQVESHQFSLANMMNVAKQLTTH